MAKSFFIFLKKEIGAAFLFLVILVSFGWHVSHRNQHFQECDSSSVYQVIREFPKGSITNSAPVYGGRNFLSKNTVQTILTIGLVKNLRLKYFSNISEEEITQRLMSLKPATLARLAIRTLLASLELPYFIQAGLAVPFSSTYSFGSGLVYGLVTHRDSSYDDFMSHAMMVSQFLFHASVVILFLISLRIGLSRIGAVFISFLMLFSISMYSYGYHLGNTVWNYSTAFLWIFFLIINWEHPQLLKRISWLTSILIFFNYLILLYWLAFLLAYFLVIARSEISRLRDSGQAPQSQQSLILPRSLRSLAMTTWQIFKSQWLAILLIIIVAGLFYPPGQGNRGTTSIATFLSDGYYIILNFFSFYNHRQLLDVLQFILGLMVIIGTLAFIFGPDRAGEKTKVVILKKTFGFLILVFAALTISGVLGFAPSRHILFLAPVVFISGGIFFDRLVFKNINQRLPLFLSGIVLGLGIVSVYLRSADVKSLANTITIAAGNDVKSIVIQDCAVDLAFKNWHTTIPVGYSKPYLFVPGEIHLYLSPTVPFNQALSDWQWPRLKHPTEVKAEILSDFFDIKDVYFTAYNPRHFYNHWPNSIHKTKFKVISIKELN